MRKIFLILTLGAFMLLPLQAFSRDYSVTFSGDNVETALKILKKTTGYDFVYQKELIKNPSIKIKGSYNNQSLDHILDDVICDQIGLSYQIVANTVVLKEVKESDKTGTEIVKGQVLDEEGEPLIGASVLLEGVATGVATDSDGKFAIKVSGKNPVIKVSYIGMHTEKIKVRNPDAFMKVTMRSDVSALEEVVVIGYGSAMRQDLTGSIESLDMKVVESSAAPNLTTMIQGQIAGLNVALGDGAPGSVANLEIRGASSLTGNNAPLIVVDDIPMSTDYDINMINPHDVKSLDVLKGASATAIYGSRASGGVIVITTKMGTRNSKPVINYSYDYTGKYLMNSLRTLGTDEFKMLLLEACRNEARAQGYDDISQYSNYKTFTTPGFFGEANTPWMSTLMQDAVTQQHKVSVQGGTSSSAYNASFSYVDEQGMIKTLYNKRYTYSVGFNTDINTKLKATIKVDGNIQDGNRNNRAMETAIEGRPDSPIYNEDGSYYHQTYTYGNKVYTMRNPLAEIEGTSDKIKRNTINLSAVLDWRPLPGLGFSARYSYQNYRDDIDYYASSETYEGSGNWGGDFNGYGRRTNYTSSKEEFELRASYQKLFKRDHYISLMVAGTYDETESENYWFAMQNYGDDDVQNGIWQGVEPYAKNPKNGYSYGSAMVSFIGRLEYKFKNRYILNASMRRDGSSRFSPDVRWGNFPSVAAAWLVSNEPFISNNIPWLSYFKLKGGWGKVGNGWVSEYAWRTMFTNTDYMGEPGIIPSTIGNDQLRWEDTESWDLGFEFGLLENQRIRGSLGIYQRKTDGLLYDLELAPSIGMSSTRVNYASIENKGIEFDVRARVIDTKDWQWNVSFNIFKNKNIVSKIDGDYVSSPGSSILSETIMKEGSSLGLIYGFQTDGVFRSQAEIDRYEAMNPDHRYQTGTTGRRTIPGDLRYVDQNGDGWVNIATNAKDDRVVLGCSRPDFEGGLSTSLSWKGLSLSMQSSFAYGHEKYWKAAANQFQFNAGSPLNVLDIALNRWTPENPDASYPAMRLNAYQNEVVDRYVYDASYWKIQNVELAYRIPNYLVRRYSFLSSAVLAFSINNVAIFSSYPGPSPESFSANVIRGGSIDYTSYPQTRNFNFSIKVSL